MVSQPAPAALLAGSHDAGLDLGSSFFEESELPGGAKEFKPTKVLSKSPGVSSAKPTSTSSASGKDETKHAAPPKKVATTKKVANAQKASGAAPGLTGVKVEPKKKQKVE